MLVEYPIVSPVRRSVCPEQQDACWLQSYVTVLLMGAEPPIAQTHTDLKPLVCVRVCVCVYTR